MENTGMITEDYINEASIIPLNFNFKQPKQNIENHGNYNLDGNTPDPMINYNDPMIQARLTQIKKRDEESIKQQRIANYKQYARNILNEMYTAVNRLIVGNRKVGFTEQDSYILLNSIKNKCNEILNSHSNQIDNDILCDTVEQFQNMLANEYSSNCQRYKLQFASNSVSFNSETGTVMFNPHGLYDIVFAWVSAHTSHRKYDDVFICG